MDDKDRKIIKDFRVKHNFPKDISDEEIFKRFSGSIVYQVHKLTEIWWEVLGMFLRSIYLKKR